MTMYSSNSSSVSLEDRKIFVGGLGWDTSEKHLNEYFGKFGEVESISVKTNPNTGRSRGFAFIVFSNTNCIDQILDGREHIINGRRVDAKKAMTRNGKIFVGGVKPELSDDEIKNFFSQFGKVIDVEVPFDKQRNQRKGFCFITFEQEHIANELLKNPQQVINGFSVDLRKATPKTDFPARGGFSGGRGRGQGYGSSYGSTPYSSYGGYGGNYNYDSNYSGYGSGSYGSGYGSGYEYTNGYGDQSYSDGQNSRGRSQQPSRHQPY